MSNNYIKQVVNQNYPYGFVTAIEADTFLPGLSEDVILKISRLKNEPDLSGRIFIIRKLIIKKLFIIQRQKQKRMGRKV